ncbi:MAG: DUF4952 domain-containing protein [Xanthomarina sp.]
MKHIILVSIVTLLVITNHTSLPINLSQVFITMGYTTIKNGTPKPYIKKPNIEANKLTHLSNKNNETCDRQYLCSDLLEVFAKKPKNLEFIDCITSSYGQVVVEANYRVSGEKSKEIEDFLVENYNMGTVEWDVIGYSNLGKNRGTGFFESEALKKIDPAMIMTITMGADGVVSDESNGIRLEKDRSKIKFFTVTVALVII